MSLLSSSKVPKRRFSCECQSQLSLKFEMGKNCFKITLIIRAVDIAQKDKWSHRTPEISSSNPVIGNF